MQCWDRNACMCNGNTEQMHVVGGHPDPFELGLDGWMIESSQRDEGMMKELLSREKRMGSWRRILHIV